MMRWVFLLVLLVPHVLGYSDTLSSWKLISSSNITATGEKISSIDYDDSEWLEVNVPCTVVACLVQNNVYPNIFMDTNLKTVDTAQFDVTWWYRTQFDIPSYLNDSLLSTARVLFKGINYRANIWMNGVLIAADDVTVGTFRYFDLDVTSHLSTSLQNILAVEVFRPHDRGLPNDNNDTDLAITFVDWTPAPPDSNMGLWRDVDLIVSGPVSVMYPSVSTQLTDDSRTARLTVLAELQNHGDSPLAGKLEARLTLANGSDLAPTLSQRITLAPHEELTAQFSHENFTQLVLSATPDLLWWPWQMGDPTLHVLLLSFTVGDGGGFVSDSLTTFFGIRQMTSELDKNKFRLFSVNNRPILIRGAGWSPDLFLRKNLTKLASEISYVRAMNLNTIRLEGKMEPDEFFHACDAAGILVMPGWCCCDAWQHWSAWTDAQMTISAQSTLDQAKRIRIHASALMWFISSDQLPPKNVEENYLRALSDAYWPNPSVSAASDRTSDLTGSTGVKMSGPYSWVSPNYWLTDRGQHGQYGGAYGFLTEGGPGENPLSHETFVQIISPSHQWPMSEEWAYHCGNQDGAFGNLDLFTAPLYARYGVAASAADYLAKAQLAAYEGHRAMFEGYSRNKYASSTGVIQWMLNSAWPSMIWHLYEYNLNPTATYFATKKACEDLHLMYSYDDDSVWIINSLYTEITQGFIATAEVLSLNSTVLYNVSAPVKNVPSDSAARILSMPSAKTIQSMIGQSTTYFLRLRLWDSSSSFVSDNFYWLSTLPDVIDWSNATWFNAPCSSYADFTELQKMPPVELHVSWDQSKETGAIKVQVTNASPAIAPFVHLRLVMRMADASVVDVLPVLWDDNYFTLLGGESRFVSAEYDRTIVGQSTLEIRAETWNNRD